MSKVSVDIPNHTMNDIRTLAIFDGVSVNTYLSVLISEQVAVTKTKKKFYGELET